MPKNMHLVKSESMMTGAVFKEHKLTISLDNFISLVLFSEAQKWN